MINSCSEAREVALNRLNPDLWMGMINDEWIIIDTDTIETNFGWLFHTDSRIHFETGNNRNRIIGMVGIIVERKTGHIASVPPIGSRRYYMRVYEYNHTRSLLSGILAILYGITDWIPPVLFRKK